MSNWYKISYNRGIPLMDEYNEGRRPPSSSHKKDPRSLVNAKPEFGGHKRPGYPRNFSAFDEDEETEYERIHGRIPGENVLMDQDPPTGEGANDDRFVSEVDKLPISSKNRSVQLDNIDVGPHNMQKGNIFKRIKKDTTIKGLKL